MRKKRVLVAMSGGVDSSLTAALLLERGFEVIGITMDLFALPPEACLDPKLKSCCGIEAASHAVKVAQTLGIEHYLLDLKKEFQAKVIADFCAEYAQGRTPNPCIRCNEQIKFQVFWEKAAKFETDFMATGHHARILFSECDQRYYLHKGDDPAKDQSYFLYMLTQQQLARSLFPIGDLTKTGVREKARKLGLPVAERPESQEICFIPDNDYAGFLRKQIPEAFMPGPIKDGEGNVLGEHNGILHYTIGQRRGLGIAAPHPLYVLEIRTRDNTLIVGENHHLYNDRLQATHLNWIIKPELEEPYAVSARIRYKHKEASARILSSGAKSVSVEFQKPQRAITPGQSVVFYQGDTVLGGGIIAKAGP
jgi:tRNA-specific 2-thiouridylase